MERAPRLLFRGPGVPTARGQLRTRRRFLAKELRFLSKLFRGMGVLAIAGAIVAATPYVQKTNAGSMITAFALP